MLFSSVLLVIGLLLVLIEFYLPGAVFGIAGGMLIFYSVLSFGMESDSIVLTLGFFIVAVVSVLGVIKFALWRIRKTSQDNTLFLGATQEGYQASEFDPDLIGKQGIAATDLGPGGYIIIDGQRYQAVVKGGYVEKGTEITVISGQGAYLVVKS